MPVGMANLRRMSSTRRGVTLAPLSFRALVASVLVCFAAGCGASTMDDSASSGDAVLGGLAATDPALDAVGGLVEIFHMANGDAYRPFCTATLIAPSLVLTAEHCARGMQPMFEYGFAVGPESARDFAGRNGPARLVMLKNPRSEETITGGRLDLGSDVAVVSLATPITDITPIPVAVLRRGDVGTKFTAVGYGERDDQSSGRRMTGQVTLRALEGLVLPIAAGTLANYQKLMGGDPAENREAFKTLTLLKDYEALTGGARGDVQLCGGDSGGPLLRISRDGTKTVFGVASWVIGTASASCALGSVYATFGPATVKFIEAERAHDGKT